MTLQTLDGIFPKEVINIGKILTTTTTKVVLFFSLKIQSQNIQLCGSD